MMSIRCGRCSRSGDSRTGSPRDRGPHRRLCRTRPDGISAPSVLAQTDRDRCPTIRADRFAAGLPTRLSSPRSRSAASIPRTAPPHRSRCDSKTPLPRCLPPFVFVSDPSADLGILGSAFNGFVKTPARQGSGQQTSRARLRGERPGAAVGARSRDRRQKISTVEVFIQSALSESRVSVGGEASLIFPMMECIVDIPEPANLAKARDAKSRA